MPIDSENMAVLIVVSIFLNSKVIFPKKVDITYWRHFLFDLPWRGQNLTYDSEVGSGWIQNVKYFSFVFVAKLYSK